MSGSAAFPTPTSLPVPRLLLRVVQSPRSTFRSIFISWFDFYLHTMPPASTHPYLCLPGCRLDICLRVAWREDGRRLVSSSDDRTVRVWSVDCSGGGGGSSEGEGTGNEGHAYGGQLLWTGWGHASRVWDVGFTRLGVVTCGEVRVCVSSEPRPCVVPNLGELEREACGHIYPFHAIRTGVSGLGSTSGP